MLVVADTSALVALAVCDTLHLLENLLGELRVPAAVFRECTVTSKPSASALDAYLRGRVMPVDLRTVVIAAAGLGTGELEAMALYRHLKANWLLVDDARARRVARHNEIEVIGSLGVLLRARKLHLISDLRSRLVSIEAAGIHFSQQLIQTALELAGEL